ncbi:MULTISPECIES: LPS export ABC transporter permease LptF [Pseudomonas]|uniref:Lipopolysaccharide export system permease protein LptF n=1 Tax=Pseudomonas luteola TaxID=47886 RepID=A0ABS0MKM9_PSELU|nr:MULTISPECIES: LPS export ABC transporter permease LptF [Pseudomonas]MBH3437289.1 LPS export ABC transporter permease LptF [Pseudomonas luteola]
MRLIERYIISEICRPLMVMVGILTFIFASYSSERYLAEAANGTLALSVVLDIVYYKVLIALEVLVPVALYVAVVLSLGRLYHDTEMTAIAASGVSPLRLYKAILLIALPVAIAVACLSLYGRPWAYDNAYRLEQQSRTDLDVNHLQAERFNVNEDNGRMILAKHIEPDSGALKDVLIYDSGAERAHLFRARQALITDPNPEDPVLSLEQGTAYSLERKGSRDQTMLFKDMTLHLAPVAQTAEYRRKAAPSSALATSSALSDQAELQWRQTRGITTLLLALFAIPLSYTAPRKGRFARMLPVTAAFALVFYASDICRSMVGNGSLPLFPGMWLIPILMMLALFVAIRRDVGKKRIRTA